MSLTVTDGIHTPGHTSNSSTYFFLLRSWLICGSHLLETIIAELLSEISPCLGWAGFQTKRKKNNPDSFQTHHSPCGLWPECTSQEFEKFWNSPSLTRQQVQIQDCHGLLIGCFKGLLAATGVFCICSLSSSADRGTGALHRRKPSPTGGDHAKLRLVWRSSRGPHHSG